MRFYFDFLSHDNDEILDCEGVELANWLAAHRHAIRIVKQTLPFIPDGPDWRGWRIQVTDKSRRQVLSVLFHAPSRYGAPGLTQNLPANERSGPDCSLWPSHANRRSGPASRALAVPFIGRKVRTLS